MILQNYRDKLIPYKGEKSPNTIYINQKMRKIYFVLDLKQK